MEKLKSLEVLHIGQNLRFKHSREKLIKSLKLEIEVDNITDESLKNLQSLKSLKKLCIVGCDKITDKGLLYLQNLKNLTDLHVIKCKKITPDGIKKLKKLLPHLTK